MSLRAIFLVKAVASWVLLSFQPQVVQAQFQHSLGDSKPLPWTNLEFNRNSSDFQFAIVSDNSGTPRFGIWKEAMQKLNLLQPEFVMSVGDLIEGYVDTKEQLHQQWDRFFSDLAPLKVPFFFVAGNHDVGRPLWYDLYRERIGPTWYHFVYNDVLFMILDTNDGPEHSTGMSDTQLQWIEEVLGKYPANQVKWTLVFQHKPLWNDRENPQWARVRRMIANRQRVTVFAGHIHNYMATQIDGMEYVALATTGGGSQLRGRDAGEIDHIAWITMKSDGPVVANIPLDGILPIDFRTNESAARYESISQGKFLQFSPIFQNQADFRRSSTHVVIKNSDEQPLRVRVLFETAEGISVKPASISSVIEPNSASKIELNLESDQPRPISSMAPVVAHWQASYDQPAKASLQWNGSSRLFVDGLFVIPETESKVIDGGLEDWPELPFLVEQPGEIQSNLTAWRGKHDARFRWGVACDQSKLYLAIEVFDDQIDHAGDMVWQDFAGVFVNPVVSVDATPDEIKKSAFAVMAGLSMTDDDKRRYRFGNPPADVQSAVKQISNRICYEFAIPTARFSELQKGRWEKLQLNVIVNDHDANDQREGLSVMYWRPKWDGAFHYPNSGIFERR